MRGGANLIEITTSPKATGNTLLGLSSNCELSYNSISIATHSTTQIQLLAHLHKRAKIYHTLEETKALNAFLSLSWKL